MSVVDPAIQEQLAHLSGQAVHYIVAVAGAALIFIIGWIITGLLQ